ncbi:hypothetical protein OAJ65_00705 [Flavobacteriales bacterium]|nr:hypothetical protein [Flavobacteriales bacterium]
MRSSYFIFFCLSVLLLSCIENTEDTIIASVNEHDLLLSDVLREMPLQTLDSTFFVQHYMNEWIRKQLMLYHAEINLSIDMQDYQKQIDAYRSSLLIYAYQQQLINQNFDTTIAIEAVTDYYNQYKEEFKLNKNIFMGRYIVVDKSAPKLSKLSKWYKSDNKEYMIELEDYCQQFAKEYYLADSNWQYFSVINNKLPEIIKKEESFLKNTKSTTFKNEQFIHYIYIKNYKIKGSISPLALEKEKIRNVLLNKNKIEYLKELEDELYQNGLALKKIKIY